MTTRPEPQDPLLRGPVLPTLARLAVPNVVLIAAQVLGSFVESYYVGRLGTEALAGAALVFPLIMLMQMMSAGGMGGGIAAAVARALGAKRPMEAEALALHAVVIAATMGAGFMLIVLAFGRPIYAAMGGQGEALDAAVTYSNWVFAGIVFLWLQNSLASVLRGSGNMRAPAVVIVGGVAVLIPLAALLVFGAGPIPPLGIAGAGISLTLYYALGCIALAWLLLSGRSSIRLRFTHALTWPRFREILRVGAASLITNIMANLTVGAATGLVGRSGTAALAGFGLGARLEYIQVPIAFGIGTALVAMIGRAVGAGDFARARRVAITGSLLAGAITGSIGIAAALFPAQWLGLFTTSADAIAAGATYLRIAGPFYGLFGFGLALYFASQGAGQMRFAITASVLRFAIVAAIGWLLVEALGFDAASVYIVIAGAFIVFAAVNAITLWNGPFRGGRR